jgi:acyl-CoA reductase-like NAD-dependent aldehyde dehydrogenase
MQVNNQSSSHLIGYRENESKKGEIQLISPIDQSIVKTVQLETSAQALEKVELAETTFRSWRSTPLQDRIDVVLRFVDCLLAKKHEIVKELSWTMGR